ncbi:MAG: SpoIIE family protein phosphatase [Candidatus Protochlamydia sp.]|nr:SpoIIE family protein phosphatase [Candidatus Protochlamydia sp.]
MNPTDINSSNIRNSIDLLKNETNSPINIEAIIKNYTNNSIAIVEDQINQTADKLPDFAPKVENLLGSSVRNAKAVENKEKFTTVGRTAEMATAGNRFVKAWVRLKAFLSGEQSPMSKTESKAAMLDIRNLISAGSQRGVDPTSEHDQTLNKVAKEILGFPDPNNKLAQVKIAASSYIRTFEVAQAGRTEGQIQAHWPSAAKSATYNATDKNNCDFVSVGREGILVIDGSGHGQEWLVASQHPILEEMANAFYSMADAFNSTPEAEKEEAAENFKELAEGIINSFSKKLNEAIKNTNTTEINSTYNKLNPLLKLLTANPDHKITDDDLKLLLKEIRDSQPKINSRLNKILNAPKSTEEEKMAAASFMQEMAKAEKAANNDEARTILKNAFNKLTELAEGTANDIAGIITPQRAMTDGGSGMALAQVVHTPTGPKLFRAQSEDCIFIEIPANGGEAKWLAEKRGTAIGGSSQKPPVMTMLDIEPGSTILTLTDGIAEFLNREEILAVIQQNPGKSTEEILAALKTKIKEMATKTNKETRYQATINPELIEEEKKKANNIKAPKIYQNGRYIEMPLEEQQAAIQKARQDKEEEIQEKYGCKVLDLSGGDISRIDDIALAMMVVRPKV